MSWFKKKQSSPIESKPSQKIISSVTVTRSDGSTVVIQLESSMNEWLGADVDESGALTIYRLWDVGICRGRAPVRSFANGVWIEWKPGSDQ